MAGVARLGEAGEAWRGEAGPGEARRGRHGGAWRGEAGRGEDWQGKARQALTTGD